MNFDTFSVAAMAAELRANLHKRKDQARSRADQAKVAPEEGPPAGSTVDPDDPPLAKGEA